MSSAALSYASGQPRRSPPRHRSGTAASASSLAADAAIRDLKGIRRRHHGEGDQRDESALGRSIDEFSGRVSATVESLGMPRWTIRAVVLAGVGLVLAVAVNDTLPMLARHAVAGTATFNGRPLAGATVGFLRLGEPAASEPRVVRTAADGSFRIAAEEGLASGLYAITVRPGESALPVPPAYRSPDTSPLRFEIREDLTGMQVSVRDGREPVRRNRR